MVFFLFVQEDPSAISTAVDVLARTEAGGKKADRLQLDVDPKLLVSSKSRGPAPKVLNAYSRTLKEECRESSSNLK
jgi:hypothetical protein